jgi:hypothetical protein
MISQSRRRTPNNLPVITPILSLFVLNCKALDNTALLPSRARCRVFHKHPEESLSCTGPSFRQNATRLPVAMMWK